MENESISTEKERHTFPPLSLLKHRTKEEAGVRLVEVKYCDDEIAFALGCGKRYYWE